MLSEYGDIVHFSGIDKEQCIAGDTDASGPTNSVDVVDRFAGHVILNYPVDMWQVQASSNYVLQHTIN